MRALAPRFRTLFDRTARSRDAALAREWPVRAAGRVAVAFVAVGLIARLVRYAAGAALWGDEVAIGLNVVARDFAGLTRPLEWMQVAPVLFLWAERAVVLAFGTAEWALRLVPFLAGVGGLLVFWSFARRAVSPTAAALAVGVLAVARWPVFMSGTVKPYSGDLFWSAVLVALAARWRERPNRLRPLVLLTVAVPFALGFSYPTVFVAGAVAVYLLPAALRHPDRRAKGLFVLYAVLMVAAFGAIYLLVADQKADPRGAEIDAFMKAYWAHGFPPSGPGAFLIWAVKVHTGRMFAFPIGDRNGGSSLTFFLFAFGVWRCWRAGQRPLLALCLLPFGLTFLAATCGTYPYGACCRLAQHLAPAICLMVGVGWAELLARLPGTARARWFAVSAVGLVAFGAGQVVFDLSRPHHDPGAQWAQWLGRELGRQMRPDDLVVVRSLTAQKVATAEWYLNQLGARVVWGEIPQPRSETRRVWVVTLANEPTGARPPDAPGQEWDPIARADYRVRSDPNDATVLYTTVVCFARNGGPVEQPDLKTWP